jgi:ankyrin repeat protein
MSASQNGHLDIVDLLLKNGANVDSQKSNGWTSLMWGAGRGRIGKTLTAKLRLIDSIEKIDPIEYQ